MNSFMNKALSASIVFGLVIIMGVLAVFAESVNDVEIHISDTEINVYSPATDMPDCEINVNIRSLFEFTVRDVTRIQTFDMSRTQCQDVLATHQEQIDNILALICEYGIDNLQELSTLLQTLQIEGDYTPIIRNACSGGCALIPVWVTINGVRHPGYRCLGCGRVFI